MATAQQIQAGLSRCFALGMFHERARYRHSPTGEGLVSFLGWAEWRKGTERALKAAYKAGRLHVKCGDPIE